MSRALDDLDSRIKPLAFELIARAAEQGVAVCVVDTLRTLAEQQENLARGVSWTMHSKHLPQPPSGKSLAIDLAPYATYLLHGSDKLMWDKNDPAWPKLGAIGEALGLRWGGRFKDKLGHDMLDPGHFELVVRDSQVA